MVPSPDAIIGLLFLSSGLGNVSFQLLSCKDQIVISEEQVFNYVDCFSKRNNTKACNSCSNDSLDDELAAPSCNSTTFMTSLEAWLDITWCQSANTSEGPVQACSLGQLFRHVPTSGDLELTREQRSFAQTTEQSNDNVDFKKVPSLKFRAPGIIQRIKANILCHLESRLGSGLLSVSMVLPKHPAGKSLRSSDSLLAIERPKLLRRL